MLTKNFFHSHASHHCNKRFIPSLSNGVSTVHAEQEKAAMAHSFNSIIGAIASHSQGLDIRYLNILSVDLQELAEPFTEEEVEKIIKDIPLDRAPGSDGFTGLFLKVAWPVIKADVMRAFDAFSVMDTRSFHHDKRHPHDLVAKDKRGSHHHGVQTHQSDTLSRQALFQGTGHPPLRGWIC